MNFNDDRNTTVRAKLLSSRMSYCIGTFFTEMVSPFTFTLCIELLRLATPTHPHGYRERKSLFTSLTRN